MNVVENPCANILENKKLKMDNNKHIETQWKLANKKNANNES